MKVVCQLCGKVVDSNSACGWILDHWLGYRFTDTEVLKVGLCPECANGSRGKASC